jgi:hypothetical protein
VNELPSSEHWNVTPDCESVNVKPIDVAFVGETDGVFPVIVGTGGADAAKTANAPQIAAARTPSSATSVKRLALLAVLVATQRAIETLALPVSC